MVEKSCERCGVPFENETLPCTDDDGLCHDCYMELKQAQDLHGASYELFPY